MELAGNISDLWRNEQDRVIYSSLIKLIQDSPSSDLPFSVFVGAGLSIQAGYPSSNELINHLIREANIELTELNSIDKFSFKAKRLKELIREHGENFYEILYRRFDEDHYPINRTIPLYQDLLKIPFKSFVTTNYDRCIEEAAELLSIQFEEIQVYPILRANDLKAKKLYHIHGRIDHNDIIGSSRSIILTADDYASAYGESSTLPVLMNAVFDSHNILLDLLQKSVSLCDYNDETLVPNNLVCRAQEQRHVSGTERQVSRRRKEDRSSSQGQAATICGGIQVAYSA